MTARSERALIESIFGVVGRKKPPGLVTGVGDDAAVVRGNQRYDFLLTQDVQVDGRHFKRRWFGGYELGWRLAAVNLSDIAAMGGTPRYAMVSAIIPRAIPARYVTEIERGVARHLASYGAALVGGNVSSTSGVLSCDLTLIGQCPRGKAWLRRARPGNAIIVVGQLGAAAAGLRALCSGRRYQRQAALRRAFKRPTPMLKAAALLRRHAVTGAIDVSDGFSTDLIHVCESSNVGCEVDAAQLPIPRAVREFWCGRRQDPVAQAISGGEDYALILSVPGRRAEAVCSRLQNKLSVPVRIVGSFTARAGDYQLKSSDGVSQLTASGWDHLL